jgi:hypothetical protein
MSTSKLIPTGIVGMQQKKLFYSEKRKLDLRKLEVVITE